MKLRYFSDLHLEFIKPNKIEQFLKKIPPGLDEVCILAGDIGSPREPNYDIFIQFVSANFKKIFIITGNHEYYNKTATIEETNIFLKEYFSKYDNVSFLSNSYEYYDNFCFIGTTLWSTISDPSYEINDVYSIPDFNYVKYNILNRESIVFLEEALKNTNSIVVTHHVPSNKLIDIKYKTPKMKPYNQWFYCDLDKLIETNKYNIKCWFYGHTHTPSNNRLHEIPFLCNPIGYPNENTKLNFAANIEIF